MRKWSIGASVGASTYCGVYAGDTKEEAIAKAERDVDVSLCHHCSKHLSGPEIEEFWAEEVFEEDVKVKR